MSMFKLNMCKISLDSFSEYACDECGALARGDNFTISRPLTDTSNIYDVLYDQTQEAKKYHIPAGWTSLGNNKHKCPNCLGD